MLILTRKIDQGIVISGNILVRVLGVERDRVKIGISAPEEITVLRQELLENDRKAAEAAAKDEGVNNSVGGGPA
jgi:carbon storage regulator CsrA